MPKPLVPQAFLQKEKGCGELTYNEPLVQMIAEGKVSLKGLKADATVFDEMIMDVNTDYFELHTLQVQTLVLIGSPLTLRQLTLKKASCRSKSTNSKLSQ